MLTRIWSPRLPFSITGITLVIFFAACSKESQDSENYLRAKIDGSLIECTSGISANKPESSAGGIKDPTVRIKGNWASGSFEFFILTESASLTREFRVYN